MLGGLITAAATPAYATDILVMAMDMATRATAIAPDMDMAATSAAYSYPAYSYPAYGYYRPRDSGSPTGPALAFMAHACGLSPAGV